MKRRKVTEDKLRRAERVRALNYTPSIEDGPLNFKAEWPHIPSTSGAGLASKIISGEVRPDEIAPDDAMKLLESLRWREDMVVTNCFGERVWLCPQLNAEGVRIGITDCCPEDEPCERHAEMDARTKN